MKILDKYIAKTVIATTLLVTLMLAGLQVFILFVNQLDAIGKGDFGILPAAWYVLMQTPYQVYLFFPMASLLGCLIGLGLMANHRELLVMRASGVSIGQVTAIVSKVALLLVIIISLLGETGIPLLARYANDYKMMMVSGGQSIRTASGVWLRYQEDFINIGIVQDPHLLKAVYQYRFNPDHSLHFARYMDSIRFENGHWQAYDIRQTDIYPDHTAIQSFETLPWDVSIKPKILKVSTIDPEEMTLVELLRYIRAKNASQQSVHQYRLAFWQRVTQPFTTLVMMLLAIPFIFGPLRSSSMGSKFLAGAAAGFGFHIINRFFGPVSQVFQWSPIIAGIGPTVVFALLGLYLMRRVR